MTPAKRLILALFMIFGMPGAAMATFNYVPAGQEAGSPIIVETAREAAQKAPVEPPKELSLPGPSAAERAKAEAALEAARNAEAKRKEAIAAKKWAEKEARERKAQAAPASLPSGGGGVAETVSPGQAMNVAPIVPPVQPAPAIRPLPVATDPGCPPLVLGKGSLKDQLTQYASSQGYQVTWNYPNDLIITNNSTFSTGTFAGNMKDLFTTLQYIGRRDISATLFQGNRALVVESSRR